MSLIQAASLPAAIAHPRELDTIDGNLGNCTILDTQSSSPSFSLSPTDRPCNEVSILSVTRSAFGLTPARSAAHVHRHRRSSALHCVVHHSVSPVPRLMGAGAVAEAHIAVLVARTPT